MKYSHIIVLCMFGFSASVSAAPDFIYLGKTNDTDHYAGPVNSATRVGGAYFGWVHSIYENLTISTKIMFDCGGEWISDEVLLEVDGNPKSLEASMLEATKKSTNRATSALNLLPWSESDLRYKMLLKTKMRQLCSSVKEKKGYEVPVAATILDQDDSKTIYSLMTGEVNRSKENIDLWMVEYRVKKTLVKDLNGEIIKDENGESLFVDKLIDEGHELSKFTINCRSRKYFTHQKVAYDKFGVINKKRTYAVPFIESKMVDVVPNSVGESIVDVPCKVYR